MVAKNLAGSHQIAPEAHGVVIASIQRNPGNRRKLRLCAPFSHPLAYQRGFAVTCRRRDQREPVLQRAIKQREPPLARDQRGMQRGHMELGDKQGGQKGRRWAVVMLPGQICCWPLASIACSSGISVGRVLVYLL